MKHLSKEQISELRHTLSGQRQSLRDEIRAELLRSDEEQYGDLAGQVHDAGEESVADLLADANVTVVSRLIGELREAEAALQRMDTGIYGLCEECDVEIPFERLKAYPTARRCLEHQKRYEQSYAGGARPKL
jgi:DnaK suppressor protein